MTAFEPGGTERQMIELVRRLDRSRWQVHVACFRARGAWLGRVAEAAASVVEFPISSFRSRRAASQMFAFARWCRALRIQVVHTADLWTNSFGLPAAALARVPVRIGNRRELNPDKTRGQIAMQRAAYSCATHVVANSNAAAERLRQERVPTQKIAVIPNGLDASRFVDSSPVRADRSQPRIITVANLRPEKGHDVLIDAAPTVLERFPAARFDIVGDGPEMPALVARARARRVDHAFTFHGHREDVPSLMRNGDVFVLPSRSEAFPNAVLEAMAAGLPIVASAVGGICELLEDGTTGLLVSPDGPSQLASRICDLLNDPTLATRLGRAARARALSRYGFDRMVAAFEHIYLNGFESQANVRHLREVQLRPR